MSDKIKVLAYCDSPTCATGFGTVSRNIFEALYKTGRYQIDILGINYWGDPHTFPYRIWPTGTSMIHGENDPYGRKKVANMMAYSEEFKHHDIVFFLQDTFILDFIPSILTFFKNNNLPRKTICYYPIDGMPKSTWIDNVKGVDYLVAYSQFGKNMTEKVSPETEVPYIIPHGANITDFHPLDKGTITNFRKRYFNKHADKLILTNVNRNQQRKDIPRTIQAFVEFRKQVPNSILYLHMAMEDQGWNLIEVCKSFGLSISEDVIFPQNFGPNQGYPRNILNLIYNASDIVVSTVTGEGFGLSWLEAMATKTPVIMPNNTAMTEFITSERGWLSDSGTNPSLLTVLPRDNEVIRPLVDVNDMVDKMVQIYKNPKEAQRRAQNAYEWITTEMDWQGKIGQQWVALFDKAYDDLKNNKVGKINMVETSNGITTETF